MAKAGREPTGLAMTQEPSVDTDDQADEVWLLSIQRKLYQWSEANPDGCYRELWNWATDLRNLRCAWRQIASNKGARTAGVDGRTVGRICSTMGCEAFLQELRDDLRAGRFQPRPCRRKWIPKPGKPGKFRPLGIPTVADRLVQGAIKNLLEPIFEATFWHVSYGFRPGRGCYSLDAKANFDFERRITRWWRKPVVDLRRNEYYSYVTWRDPRKRKRRKG